MSTPSRLRTSSLVFAAALASCDPSTPNADVSDLAVWSVAPDPILTIGETDGAAEYVFSRVEAVRVLPDLRIAAIDGASQTLRIFARDGTLDLQVGGRGQGPGEFTDLYYLDVLPPDRIVLYDVESLRFTTLTAGGELVGVQQIEPSGGHPALYFGTYSNGDRGLGWIGQRDGDVVGIVADAMELGRFDIEGQFESRVGSMPGLRRSELGVLPFSPALLTAMVADTVFLSDGTLGRILAVRPGGDTLRVIDVPFDQRVPGDAWDRLDALIESTSARERLRGHREVVGADSVPAFSDMLAADDGNFWMKLYDPVLDSRLNPRSQAGGDWLVIDREGRGIARLTLPLGFRLMDVRDGELAGISRDDLGVERLQLLRRVAQ